MNSHVQSSLLPSPYTAFMHETKVDLGNGIELHVEVGGQEKSDFAQIKAILSGLFLCLSTIYKKAWS
jgi:hypothetical protein